MNKFVCFVLLFVAVAFAASLSEKEDFALKQQFAAYSKKFNKVYATENESAVRFQNFKESLKRIEHKNLMNPKAHYALNKFSDMALDEFRAKYLMKKTPSQAVIESCLATGIDSRVGKPFKANAIPASYDWRTYGKVTPVKDQGQCGSCWTFSTTGAIESAYAIKNNVNATLELSEQAIVDCSHACSMVDGQSICNQGCNGGWQWTALADTITFGGLPTEDDYPYTAEDGTCQIKGKKLFAVAKNFTCLSGPNQQGAPADETTLMPTVMMQNGPLSIALNADLVEDYDSGVIDPYFPDEECDPTSLDHAVLIVGWGVDQSEIWGSTPYWIVKNSWAEDWGENGYFRIYRGEGLCGLNNAVMTVLMP